MPPALRHDAVALVSQAVSDLHSNLALFLHIDDDCPMAPTCCSPHARLAWADERVCPPFEASIAQAGTPPAFAVRICVSDPALGADHSTALLTHALAHQIGHALEAEKSWPLRGMWRQYEDHFLAERGSHVKPWERPLEINAELFARRVMREMHGAAGLDALRPLHAGPGYDCVLAFEVHGDFDVEAYFADVVGARREEFLEWHRHHPVREVRQIGWLWQLSVLLKRQRSSPGGTDGKHKVS